MNLIERIFAINFFSSFVFPTLASKLNSVKRSSRSFVYTFDILILSFAKTDAKSARAPGLSSPVAFIKALYVRLIHLSPQIVCRYLEASALFDRTCLHLE